MAGKAKRGRHALEFNNNSRLRDAPYREDNNTTRSEWEKKNSIKKKNSKDKK